jgi:hypothetical protein
MLSTVEFMPENYRHLFWDAFFGFQDFKEMQERFKKIEELLPLYIRAAGWLDFQDENKHKPPLNWEYLKLALEYAKIIQSRKNLVPNGTPSLTIEFANALIAWLESCNFLDSEWIPEEVLHFLDVWAADNASWNAALKVAKDADKKTKIKEQLDLPPWKRAIFKPSGRLREDGTPCEDAVRPWITSNLGGYAPPDISINPPTFPRFDPEVKTVNDYVNQVTKMAEEYAKQVHDEHMALGLKKVSLKLNIEHFRWLVMYQCLELNYAEIARAEKLAKRESRKNVDNTVMDGVKRAAELIRMVLRVPKKGRPRKK